MEISFLVDTLSQKLKQQAVLQDKAPMEGYMKNQFEFHGIKSVTRKTVLKTFESQYKIELQERIRPFALACFKQPVRELHYCAQELAGKHLKKKWLPEDFDFIVTLITTHSWWDTVDHLAKHLMGTYISTYPNQELKRVEWLNTHENMWINRTAILYQLAHKERTNQELLFQICIDHIQEKEFFIRKGIGWALREYSKTNPAAVWTFSQQYKDKLSPLSYKEATRLILK